MDHWLPLEAFDEYEEWHLKLQHYYCIVCCNRQAETPVIPTERRLITTPHEKNRPELKPPMTEQKSGIVSSTPAVSVTPAVSSKTATGHVVASLEDLFKFSKDHERGVIEENKQFMKNGGFLSFKMRSLGGGGAR